VARIHPDSPNDRIAYSPAEVALLVGLSRKAVYRAIERGDLAASRVASRLRIRPTDVDAWLDAGQVERSRGIAPSVADIAISRRRTSSLRALFRDLDAR
jgi:excisionase family DNA binding protein